MHILHKLHSLPITKKLPSRLNKNGGLMIISVLCFTLFILTNVAFWPGFMSNDTINQLLQAKDMQPLANWHPPAMALLWKILIICTGSIGSFLLLQTGLLWLSLGLISARVYIDTSNVVKGIAVLIIGVLPFVANFAGVIWKDVAMSFLLLLAVSLTIWLAQLPKNYRGRPVLFICAFAALILAVLFRYNALMATLPLAAYLAYTYFGANTRNIALIITASAAIPFLSLGLLSQIVTVKDLKPETYFFIDDIRNNKSSDSRVSIINQNPNCQSVKPAVNAYWLCYNETERLEIKNKAEDIKKEWLAGILQNPAQFTAYKINLFWRILVQQDATPYVWQSGIVPNQLGLTDEPNFLTRTLEQYVFYANRDLGFIFRPLTWLLIPMLLAFFMTVKRARYLHTNYHKASFALYVSAVLYAFSYLPLGASYDFRYFYWSSLATSLGILLYILNIQPKKKVNRAKK